MAAARHGADAAQLGIRAVARVGDPAPEELGGTYEHLVAGTVDDRGEVAFSARLSGSAVRGVIVQVSQQTPRVVARTGDEAPCGGRYRSFGAVDLACDGSLLFHAKLDGHAAAEGLFLRTRRRVRTVAVAGAPTPGGATTYASFSQPTLADAGPGSGGLPALAFVARLADGRTCVVQHPAHRAPVITLASGTELPGGSVEDMVISRLGYGLCAIVRLRDGQRRFEQAVVVAESVVSCGDRLREGGRMPGLGRITRLLRPPAVNVQMGFVTLRAAGGRQALCSRPPAMADPAVLLASGDPVPGLGGERVAGLGVPVASASAALQSPFGLACPVRLASGRAALWLGVFHSQLPIRGAATTVLADRKPASDLSLPSVGRCTPVKLSNSGTLLLRTLAGREGDGLVAVDGVFDWYHGYPTPPGPGDTTA
jgi:hypothetical protein